MIKFFRHIRRKLISENKMGKYFKYAIGEILLVVLGILIALQVNNWNNERISNKLVKQSLNRMKTDINNDIEGFEYNLKFYNKLEKRNDSIYNKLVNLDKGEVMSFRPWVIHVPGVISSNDQTYQEMLNTGNFYAIDDKDLISAISSYYSFAQEYNAQTNFANQKVDASRDIDQLQPFWTLSNRLEISDNIDTSWLYNPNSSIFISLINFLKDSKNANLYKARIYSLGLEQAQALLISIDKALKNYD